MTGRVHVVAGATGRMGGALVSRFMAQGDVVVGLARDRAALADLASTHPQSFLPCGADLLDDASVDALRAAVGNCSVGFVVNAARSSTPGGVHDVAPGDLGRAVNLKAGGLLRLVRAVDPQLGEGSRVVAIGGRLGYDADPAAAAAGVANAAVGMLIRQLAIALGPRGISCHVIAPGAMAHGDGSAFVPSGDPVARASAAAQAVAAVPLGRLPTVEDVVSMIGVLAQPAAAFLNGGTMIMDGGRRTAMP